MQAVSFWELLESSQIRIPIIQRDYAQGRRSDKVDFVREEFLHNLHDACKNNNPLHLDFIYGEQDGPELLPFDGQQRLTTLYLLHWYAAVRQGELKEEVANRLAKFRYEVRNGTRIFGQELINPYNITDDHPVCRLYSDSCPDALSSYLKDQPWFRPQWILDPTITGMLTMLDAIHKYFYSVDNLWRSLTNTPSIIQFYFTTLADLSLPADEIFIKMNARGKQLTEFEHFKARFLDCLRECRKDGIDGEGGWAVKFDNQWSDLFWTCFARHIELPDKAGEADRCFTKFLRFMADIFLRWPDDAREGIPTTRLDADKDDLFECLRPSIHNNREQVCPEGNIAFLFGTLDQLASLSCAKVGDEQDGIELFFEQFFASVSPDAQPVQSKISLFSTKTNLFSRCCLEHVFSIADRLLLFASLLVLWRHIEPEIAAARLRILRNLLENSEYELRDVNFPEQLKGVYQLIVDGALDKTNGFNGSQQLEEEAKATCRHEHATDDNLLAAMDYLEDHPLLRGNLTAFCKEVTEPFHSLVFTREMLIQGQRFFDLAFGQRAADYDVVVRGLLRHGDYAYRYGPQRLYLGKTGDNAGKLSRKKIFTAPGCRQAIQALATEIKQCASASDMEQVITSIADNWVDECQQNKKMDWRYYFVKYAETRPQEDDSGLYFWGYSKQSFNQLKLIGSTRQSQHWNPFLWAAVVTAGFAEEPYEGIDSWGLNDEPLFFPWCNLALWWSEFSWRIGSRVWNRKLGENQTKTLTFLRNQFPKIDEDGWLHIPGKDFPENENVDYRDPQSGQYRSHDETDRIALIAPVIKTIYALRG